MVIPWGQVPAQGWGKGDQIRGGDRVIEQSAAWVARYDDVFRDHMDDIGVVETPRNGQLFQFASGQSRDLDEQTIDRVIDQQVIVDLRSYAIIIGGKGSLALEPVIAEECFFKAIGRGAHGRVGP